MTKSRQGQQIQPCSYFRSCSFLRLSVASRPLWCSCSHKTLFLQIQTLFPNTKPPPPSAWRTQGALEGRCYGNPSRELQLATSVQLGLFTESHHAGLAGKPWHVSLHFPSLCDWGHTATAGPAQSWGTSVLYSSRQPQPLSATTQGWRREEPTSP